MANITYTITQDGDEISYTINDGVGPVGPAGPNNITTSTETDITGILKGDGANVSAAVEDTDYQGVPAEGAFADGDKTKLDGIEAGADVTDATNVNAAGAVMESDYSPSHSVLAQQSGTGSPSAVSLGTDSLLGRASSAGTAIQGLTAAQARTLLNVEDGATADQTAAEILTAIKTVDGTGSGLDADLLDGQDSSAFATSAQGALADSAVQPGDIDTLAELNAIITDATLIDTTDSRLSDARTPTAHTHTVEDIDFAGSTEIGADLADADEILVSDGGGNTTRRKSLVSRIWTYIKAKIESVGLASLDITGDLTVDTSTLHVDSANNRVGIGDAIPDYPLHLKGTGTSNGVAFGLHASDDTSRFQISDNGSWQVKNSLGNAKISYDSTAYGGAGLLNLTGGRIWCSNILVASGAMQFGTGGSNTNDISFNSNGAVAFKIEGTTGDLEIGTTNSITFADNSGTWNGATISGDQDFTGQVELTGQAASTDDSVMTRSLSDARYERILVSHLTADSAAVNNSTTLASSGLSLSLEASTSYRVDCYVNLQNLTTTAAGFRWAITYSGTLVGKSDLLHHYVRNNDTAAFDKSAVGAEETLATDANIILHITGTIRTNTSGTLEFKFAQETANASNTFVRYPSELTAAPRS